MLTKMSMQSRPISQKKSQTSYLLQFAGLLALALSVPAVVTASSSPFPTYEVGRQGNGSYVVSDGQVITPAGTQVDLGILVRAKAVAVNPTLPHTAAVG